MNILNAEQIREADQYTIQQECMSSWNLMERASGLLLNSVLRDFPKQTKFRIISGAGNNGGDGLAITRKLLESGYVQSCCYLLFAESYSHDNFKNRKLLEQYRPGALHLITGPDELKDDPEALWIDAIFGTGLSRKPENLYADAIDFLNRQSLVISVDLPSGLFTEGITPAGQFVQGKKTYTFESPKEGLLLPAHRVDFKVIPIGLNPEPFRKLNAPNNWITRWETASRLKNRPRHSHKNDFGHLLLAAGSADKPGAAVMAMRASLHSGCGLVTALLADTVRATVLSHCPEAMSIPAGKEILDHTPDNLPENISAIAAGPGCGISALTAEALNTLLGRYCNIPVILDADALNMLAKGMIKPELLTGRTLLTPHPGEFRRLAGDWHNDEERIMKLKNFAAGQQVWVILKDTYTLFCNPQGKCWYSSGGSAGMARGGSGDVLTGLLAGLLAAGYHPEDAAIAGLWLHGHAGEIACDEYGIDGMTAMHLAEALPAAWKSIRGNNKS